MQESQHAAFQSSEAKEVFLLFNLKMFFQAFSSDYETRRRAQDFLSAVPSTSSVSSAQVFSMPENTLAFCFFFLFFSSRAGQSVGSVWVGQQHRTSPSPANAPHSFATDRETVHLEGWQWQLATGGRSRELIRFSGVRLDFLCANRTEKTKVTEEKFMSVISDFNKVIF